MLGGVLSPRLGPAAIAVPRARECTEVLRLVRGTEGARVTVGKGRQLVLCRANGGQQRARVERGELLAQALLDGFIDAAGGKQPLIRVSSG